MRNEGERKEGLHAAADEVYRPKGPVKTASETQQAEQRKDQGREDGKEQVQEPLGVRLQTRELRRHGACQLTVGVPGRGA